MVRLSCYLRWTSMMIAVAWVLQSSAAPNKWTVFIYMLADNDLEQFALLDMEEVMAGMSAEPVGCITTSCGGSCPTGMVLTYSTACPSGDGIVSRCCPADSYPDVLLLVDRGTGQPTAYLQNSSPHGDYTLLNSEWTTAKELLAMPGGQWNQLKDLSEIDMSKPDVISAFLTEGLSRYPPSANRKYMLVFWDHGSGWSGYGVDHTCSSTASYNQNWGCDILSVQGIASGLAAGLKDPATGGPVVLDIIGFDACLMAMYEVGALMSPFARYLLASEVLEPGHGWDYAAPLRGLIQQQNAAGQSLSSFEANDVGDLVIKGYMDQAAFYETSGLTMALLDLSVVSGALEVSLNAMTQYLSNQLQNSPAYSMGVMRKRALLTTITGATDNVDLGAMLTGFKALTGSSLAALTNTSAVAYSSVVKSYQRDGELADGTGMAIYFPSSTYNLDSRYNRMVSATSAALSNWLMFLQSLYAATDLYTSSKDLGAFTFQEQFAVCYLATSSNTWITHGTLSNYLGITASLMYGFRTPSGTEFITAGNTEASIVERSAVGTWSGYLFGLIQDLVQGDNAVDGLALAYADESRLVDSDGNVKQLILQVKVYYASSCYASITDMKKGIIKYVYDTATAATTMQLYVTSSGGSWGEVPPAQGGVVIPYLGSYNFSAAATASSRIGVSFGYSDCLKWGYSNGIQLAAFNAAQAADVLGLDLARDMETQLLVTSMNGDVVSLSGYFRPAQKTLAGCQCSQWWSYTNSSGAQIYINGTCINPTNDPLGSWCVFEPDSCSNATAVANATNSWDYCAATTTLSGCKCHPHWTLNNKHYYGTSLDDGGARGPWCVVDRATCPGAYRAHQYGASNTLNATVNGQAGTLTGLDFDYTKQITVTGCKCRNPWTYAGVTYYGTCRQGVEGSKPLPGFSANASWCYIDEGCKGAGDWEGYRFDVCTPEGGRVATDGSACQLPTIYQGVPMYDCLNYQHDAGTTTQPWCFAADGTVRVCAPWTCSGPVKTQCPAADPSSPGADLTGWAGEPCLGALCGARQALVNISQCTTDSTVDQTMLQRRFQFLNGSSAFGQLLTPSGGAGSLASYCDVQYGRLCVDLVVDPSCPALFRDNNKWWIDSDPAKMCNTDCLKTLCILQEHAKTQVQGAPNWQSSVSAARGFTLPDSSCSDASLESLVRWTMMQSMDSVCGWPGPVSLACNRMLSPPQLCTVSTTLTGSAGNITDGVPGGSYYSASSSCSWTINTPEQPYITLDFSTFDTEQLYDILTVEDFDGVIGMFSGSDLPPNVSTDTGLIKLQFTSDGSVQGHGFSASYMASSSPQVKLPVCSSSSKLMQVVLRSRQYGAELSWLINKRSAASTILGPSSIVMAGGLLPSGIKSKLPKAVADAADGEYKDYRSYYSYACLPLGDYNLNLYDSYGDGWNDGRITVTQIVNASTGCQLLSETIATSNKTIAFSITADADTNSEACSSLVTQDSAPYYAEAGIVIMGEEPSTFNLAKQRKIKEALAQLLDVDASDVTVLDVSVLEEDTLTKVQWSVKGAGAAAVISSQDPTRLSRNSNGSDNAGLSVQPVSQRSLLGDELRDQSTAAEGSIRQMLQHQAAGGFGAGHGIRGSRRKALSALAVPLGELVSSGVLGNNDRQLLAEQLYLTEPPAGGAADVHGVTVRVDSHDQRSDAAYDTQQQASDSDDEGLACGNSNTDATQSSAAPADAAESAASSLADSAAASSILAMTAADRKLQQIVALGVDGQWQSVSLQPPTSGQDSKPPATAGDGGFSASEGPGDVPVVPAAVEVNQTGVNQTNSTAGNSSSGTGSSSGPDISAVLSAQSVVKPDLTSGEVHTQVLISDLEPLLRPLQPTAGPTVKKTPAGAKPKTVELTIGFRDAFMPPVVAAASSSSTSNRNTKLPLNDGISRHEEVDTLLYDGPVLPATPQPTAEAPRRSSSSSSREDEYMVFDAIRPSRSLIEDNTSNSSNGRSSNGGHRRGRKQHYRQRQSAQGPAAIITADTRGIGTLNTQAAAEFVRDGRVRHSTPRPRPKPVIPDGGDLQQEAGAASPRVSRFHGAPGMQAVQPDDSDGLAASVMEQQQEQQTFRLMGPKRAIRRRQPPPMIDPVAVHRVPLHFSQPFSVDGVMRDTSSAEINIHQRHLLTISHSSGVLVVTRVSGFKSQKLAAAAADTLEAVIVNGTLATTLASQGWTNVTLGVAFTRTGRRLGSFGGVGMGLIVGVAAAGGVLLCAAAVVGWYVKKKRLQGAAVPHTDDLTAADVQHNFRPHQQHSLTYGINSRVNGMPAPSVPGVPVVGYPVTAPLQQASLTQYPAGLLAASAASAPMVAYSGQGYGAPMTQGTDSLPRVADVVSYSPLPLSPCSYTAGVFNSSHTANPFAGTGQPQAMYGGPPSPRSQPFVGPTQLSSDPYTAQWQLQQQYNVNGRISPPPVYGLHEHNSGRTPMPYRPVSPALL